MPPASGRRSRPCCPSGVRHRQLRVRTLLAGMLLTQADHRPAHLTRVRDTLIALPADDQRRLGVTEGWKGRPHLLTCRQTERTFGLVASALGEDDPGGLPTDPLQRICDDLLEASVPGRFTDASRSLAMELTDLESFSRPPTRGTSHCADPEAAWGQRKNYLLRSQDELFYGYYLSAGIMMPEENGPAVPEFARRVTASSCRHDPVRALVPVLTAMPAAGIPLGDVLAGSGYAHRDAGAWAVPLRAAGAQLVQELHPHDRGAKGTPTAPSSPTAACTAPPHPGHCWNSRHSPATPPQTRRRPRPADSRACPLQTQPHHQQRRRRLPAGRLPRGHRQNPLPPPTPVHDPGPGPARDPHSARTSSSLLHPADPHRPPARQRQDCPETPLPVKGAPPLLRPPHRRRARLRRRQRSLHQHHQPRPANGAARHSPRSPLPHPRPNGQASIPAGNSTPQAPRTPHTDNPEPCIPTKTHEDPRTARHSSSPAGARTRTGMSEANVNIGLTET